MLKFLNLSISNLENVFICRRVQENLEQSLPNLETLVLTNNNISELVRTFIIYVQMILFSINFFTFMSLKKLLK